MFGSLKEKLKNWTSKVKEDIFGKEEPEEKPKKSNKTQKISKKTTKKENKISKTSKKVVKTKEKQKKKSPKIEIPETEEIQGIKQEIQEITAEEEPLTEEPKKQGFFSKIFKSELTQEKFDELFQELELTLLQNNVAYGVVEKIKQELSSRVVGKNKPEIEKELKEIVQEILIDPPNFIQEIKDSLKNKKPFVICLLGINGAGKTTTIAKLTHLLQKNKLSVCFAAADTYRAASIEQLETHANNLNVPIIKKDYGSDPASVGFEAISYAKKHNIDIVIIDTAGRLQNKDSLMKELEKIIKVTNPDMKIFTGESTTGNDATEQAKIFNELVDITGTILSKADIDEKGGTMISVGYITKKPILFLGTGQSYEDLEIFNKEKIIKGLGL
jgi:fused signal recognition particle receptor